MTGAKGNQTWVLTMVLLQMLLFRHDCFGLSLMAIDFSQCSSFLLQNHLANFIQTWHRKLVLSKRDYKFSQMKVLLSQRGDNRKIISKWNGFTPLIGEIIIVYVVVIFEFFLRKIHCMSMIFNVSNVVHRSLFVGMQIVMSVNMYIKFVCSGQICLWDNTSYQE